ncbi:unnamed protein product [Vitrella brassicaformis CCMP3155]|uniref:Uncharacterized protein n=1 Tax=Vitrella brassicaformis (strain CCMP3155) TaxID=1169540 RepID=A0A0G4H1G1_VITBC|nr:unnamed protein product [Vitrella brassicaformis CCMP3155]|eukprot:CEM37435.1 unnamed protein product [Vitrella brassicaformis CCMP3155]
MDVLEVLRVHPARCFKEKCGAWMKGFPPKYKVTDSRKVESHLRYAGIHCGNTSSSIEVHGVPFPERADRLPPSGEGAMPGRQAGSVLFAVLQSLNLKLEVGNALNQKAYEVMERIAKSPSGAGPRQRSNFSKAAKAVVSEEKAFYGIDKNTLVRGFLAATRCIFNLGKIHAFERLSQEKNSSFLSSPSGSRLEEKACWQKGKIAHRDLKVPISWTSKPHNVLMVKDEETGLMRPVVCDFGTATSPDTDGSTTRPPGR